MDSFYSSLAVALLSAGFSSSDGASDVYADDEAPPTLRSPGSQEQAEAREMAAWVTVEAGVEELRRQA